LTSGKVTFGQFFNQKTFNPRIIWLSPHGCLTQTLLRVTPVTAERHSQSRVQCVGEWCPRLKTRLFPLSNHDSSVRARKRRDDSSAPGRPRDQNPAHRPRYRDPQCRDHRDHAWRRAIERIGATGIRRVDDRTPAIPHAAIPVLQGRHNACRRETSLPKDSQSLPLQ